MLNQYVLNAQENPKLCFIWMHGLGADAQDMLGLADALQLPVPTKHIALEAPIRPVTCNQSMLMRAWYDITELSERNQEDEEGIQRSIQAIHKVIETQISEGFDSTQIVLAGFSQGGAMALIAGLSTTHSLGGIVSLSAYLPTPEKIMSVQNAQTPFFIGFGLHDEVVLPTWTEKAIEWLKAKGFSRVSDYRYPITHTVSFEEMVALSHWVSTHIDHNSDH